MDDSGGATSPPATPAAADIAAAERLILQWDPSSSSSPADERMLFSSNRDDAARYLKAVDEIRRSLSDTVTASPKRLSSSSSSSSTPANNALQIAMARLEDEFRGILISKANEVEIDAIVDLSSLSMSSDQSGDGNFSDDDSSLTNQETESSNHSNSSRIASYRSTKSIREIDLLPYDAIADLRSIADRMIDAGYGRECVQVYGSVRKAAIDLCLRRLGVEKLSISDVQKLEWEVMESKIRRWIRAAKACVRIVFASERSLCDGVFESESDSSPFLETVKGPALQLFGFPDAISIGRRSPEKLFKILDLHDAISDLLPDIETVFRSSNSSDSIYSHAADILSRLTEAVRGILSEFENAVLREPSKIPVPGGTIHPLTRYVMNYISLISDYKQTLVELIVTKPLASSRFSGEDSGGGGGMEIEMPEVENEMPLASHLVWIIAILQFNLENKANLYKDNALSHLFLMNNVHYITHKVKGSPELRELIGDDYLRKLTGKFRQSATSYQRATWVRILYCLRDEGIHVSGSFSSGVSKSTLRERFKAFNAAFDEAHRIQASWFVPDSQLREELRISISEKLLPAYRAFLGRFRHHIESGRHPEMYIKYSVDDLEMALSDFFEGCPPNLLSRWKSH